MKFSGHKNRINGEPAVLTTTYTKIVIQLCLTKNTLVYQVYRSVVAKMLLFLKNDIAEILCWSRICDIKWVQEFTINN